MEKIKYQLYYQANGRTIYFLQTEWNTKLKKGLIFTIYKVTITELYAYVSDSFDFEGEQSLGYWSIKNKDFSLIPHINNYQYIENDTFVRFKKKL